MSLRSTLGPSLIRSTKDTHNKTIGESNLSTTTAFGIFPNAANHKEENHTDPKAIEESSSTTIPTTALDETGAASLPDFEMTNTGEGTVATTEPKSPEVVLISPVKEDTDTESKAESIVPPENDDEKEANAEKKSQHPGGDGSVEEAEEFPTAQLSPSEKVEKADENPAADDGSRLSLVFADFIDLQTRLVLVPYIEEEGKGAIVASYPENDRFEGLVLASMGDENNCEAPQSMDFTDILAILREQPTPICLKFQEIDEEEEDESRLLDVDLCENDNDEEKKDDDCSLKPVDSALSEETEIAKTPRAGNHDKTKAVEPPSPPLSPRPTYSEKRHSTPSKEHTKSLNSALDDHRDNEDSSSGNNMSLSSGMFALSAWGMRMKAQSEKLLAATAKAAQQQNQKQSQNAAAKSTPNKNGSASQEPSPHCDMFLQTNLGAYFPISKVSCKTIKPQQLQAVSTSSLFCIRKSATEPCPIGRNNSQGNPNPVKYSFQWYRSSSKKKPNRRDRFPISPSTLYSNTTENHSNFDNDSIGDTSTLTSKRSRTYSSAESVSSSCSSWSSSSNNSSCSSSSSSYSMSTAGVTHHSISLASATSASNTFNSNSKGTHKGSSTTMWIALKGATGATFQPNTTLVGKKLRCVVTIRQRRGSSSDEDDSSRDMEGSGIHNKHGSSASLSSKDSSQASAIMDADDDAHANDISVLDDDDIHGEENSKIGSLLDDEEEEGVEKIVCDLATPIQADMVLFNGARQVMMTRGSTNFGNLVGREEARGGKSSIPATETPACGKTFRIEVATVRKTVLYTPTPPPPGEGTIRHPEQQKEPPKPHRRIVNVNSIQISCRSSPEGDYVQLTDTPLMQVTARASPTNSKHVDLLFPAIPPLPTPVTGCGESGEEDNEEGEGNESATHRFLRDYCIVDSNPFCSDAGVPRLELEAPNRMTRESFLLTLGIANFRGKPVELDNKKVLYRDNEPLLQPRKAQQHQSSSASIDSSQTSPKSNSQSGSPPSFVQSSTSSKSPQPAPEANDVASKKKEGACDSESSANGGKNHRQQLSSGNLSLSPSCPADVMGGSKSILLSPISCQSNGEGNPQSVGETPDACPSIPEAPVLPSVSEENVARVRELERELGFLRAKLARKDKIVTELQRQVQGTEAAHQKTKQALSDTRQDLKRSQEDCERIQMSKRHVERSMQSQHEAMQKLESNHKAALSDLEGEVQARAEKITELEKFNRSLQNEKAVLGATVEARESKLVKLEELQVSNSELSKKVAQQGALEARLEESHKKYERLQLEFERGREAEANCQKELEAARNTIQTIRKRIQGDQEKVTSCQNQLEVIQKQNQQLKGERNSYKQKNESLSKEVARLCKGGRNLRDIEKALSDHEALLQETELLRLQKRKALEEAHKYRISYEQAKAAEELSLKPDEKETRRLLERTAELERLLSEMTDYVSAKEMQLDTMRAVHEELQREIHSLAQANLRRDEV